MKGLMKKSIKERIEELEKGLFNLKKEVIGQKEKNMTDIEGEITFKAFGMDSSTAARSQGVYEKCGLWLDKRFVWEIVTDDWGGLCLIITDLKEEGS